MDAVLDDELVNQFRQTRSESALESLIQRHVPRIRAMIYPIVLDDNAADDLTQETMLRAVRAIDSFDGRSQFATWLYRIAMNVTYDFLNRQSRSPVVYQSEVVDQSQCDTAPDQSTIAAELSFEIESAVAALTPKLRVAIVLTAIEGLTAGEASAVENCKESTMYWRIHEARRQLKQSLRGYLS